MMSALKILLAILLPPLAVLVHEGPSQRFWIDTFLTLLFYVPGVIFAIIVISSNRRSRSFA